MPAADYMPTKEGDLVPWTENFITVANANLAALGLTAPDITAITTNKSNYSTGLNNAIAKQADAKGATDNKNEKKSVLQDNIRALAKQIQGKPGVPDSLKVQLGIKSANPTPPSPNPVPPIDLSSETIAGSAVRLKWNRNGNSQTTIFMLEASAFTDKDFVIVDSTTKTTIDTTFRIPSGATFFRVKAKKNDQTSDPSNVVAVG